MEGFWLIFFFLAVAASNQSGGLLAPRRSCEYKGFWLILFFIFFSLEGFWLLAALVSIRASGSYYFLFFLVWRAFG
jgi:hypothetical protein